MSPIHHKSQDLRSIGLIRKGVVYYILLLITLDSAECDLL